MSFQRLSERVKGKSGPPGVGIDSVAWPVKITTLWNTNVRKQAINDKLQGNVAT